VKNLSVLGPVEGKLFLLYVKINGISVFERHWKVKKYYSPAVIF
jgi:hypothetical protein